MSAKRKTSTAARVVLIVAFALIAHYSALRAYSEPIAFFFTASWCPHCRAMKPAIEDVQRAGYRAVVVDVDTHQALAQALQINTIPAVVIYDDATKQVRAKRESVLGPVQLRTYLSAHGVQSAAETAQNAPPAAASAVQPKRKGQP